MILSIQYLLLIVHDIEDNTFIAKDFNKKHVYHSLLILRAVTILISLSLTNT